MRSNRLPGASSAPAQRAPQHLDRGGRRIAGFFAASLLSLGLIAPSTAFAAAPSPDSDASNDEASCTQQALVSLINEASAAGEKATDAAIAALSARECVLEYDPALIAQIGSQQTSGHWVCCPGFSCAYGDAIIHGTANSHAQYGCGVCMWPGWGGGNSSFRSLGSDQALLREAYDSIAAGKPTVIHVTSGSGEHWICLMGYTGVTDPDALSLANFIALDPVDGAQINAASRYALYGDHCEHVSDAL